MRIGRTFWIANAHRVEGKRVRAEAKLTAFVEVESAIHAASITEIPSGRSVLRNAGREHGTDLS